MFDNLAYRSDTGPLTTWKGHPVYLATILAVVSFASMLLCAGFGTLNWIDWLGFTPFYDLTSGRFWRMLTWPAVVVPAPMTIAGTFFLFFQGREIETTYGRKVFGLLYGLLTLLGLVVALLWHGLWKTGLVTVGEPLLGNVTANFCVFLGVCFMHPRACCFGLAWLQLRWIGAVLFIGHALQFTGARLWPTLITWILGAFLTYRLLRAAGLGPRFDEFRANAKDYLPGKPKLRVLRNPDGNPRPAKGRTQQENPTSKYAPKILPRPDLVPDWEEVQEIDGILEKIGRTGMDSLTDAERAALKAASEKLKDREKHR